MRPIIAAVLFCELAGARSAAAQPQCAVTIVRAPDDVREAVEKWVSAEPRCTRSLELRAVATADGIYLVARDEHGRLFERLVPDPQSAGVLVASWIADDGLGHPAAAPAPGPAPAAAPPAPVAMPGPEAPAPAPGQAAPPVSVAEAQARAIALETTPEAPLFTTPSGKWVTFGGLQRLAHEDGKQGYGGRAELDVAALGPWRLGAAIEMSKIGEIEFLSDAMKLIDTRGLVTLARTFSHGIWMVRVQAGVGASRVTVDGSFGHAAGVFPVGEFSTLIGVQSQGWGLAVGPVLSWSNQTLRDENEFVMPELMHRDANAMVFGALRRRL